MRLAVLLLSATVVLLLAGAIPLPSGDSTDVFRTPIFTALLGAIAAALAVQTARRRPWPRWLPFALCHLAVLITLLGAFLTSRYAVQRQVVLSTEPGAEFAHSLPSECGREALAGLLERIGIAPHPNMLNRLGECRHSARDRESVPLGFGLAARDFSVQYYDPAYQLWRLRGTEETFVRLVRPERAGALELGEAGRVYASDLLADGEWRRSFQVSPEWRLVRASPTPKRFQAKLKFLLQGREEERLVAVNQPVQFQSWRFYLGSYERPERGSEQAWNVTLTARRDPGRLCAVAGFWLMMLGVACLCFLPRPPSGAAAATETPK